MQQLKIHDKRARGPNPEKTNQMNTNFLCWMLSGTSVGNPSSLWVGQMVSRGALFSWWTRTYHLVSQKTKRLNNSLLISQKGSFVPPSQPTWSRSGGKRGQGGRHIPPLQRGRAKNDRVQAPPKEMAGGRPCPGKKLPPGRAWPKNQEVCHLSGVSNVLG